MIMSSKTMNYISKRTILSNTPYTRLLRLLIPPILTSPNHFSALVSRTFIKIPPVPPSLSCDIEFDNNHRRKQVEAKFVWLFGLLLVSCVSERPISMPEHKLPPFNPSPYPQKCLIIYSYTPRRAASTASAPTSSSSSHTI